MSPAWQPPCTLFFLWHFPSVSADTFVWVCIFGSDLCPLTHGSVTSTRDDLFPKNLKVSISKTELYCRWDHWGGGASQLHVTCLANSFPDCPPPPVACSSPPYLPLLSAGPACVAPLRCPLDCVLVSVVLKCLFVICCEKCHKQLLTNVCG